MIGTLNGTLFAGACRFVVTFTGKDGHAAFPHEGNDTIVAASSFVQQTQTIISRNVNPTESAVITFGEFNGGTADNIIATAKQLLGFPYMWGGTSIKAVDCSELMKKVTAIDLHRENQQATGVPLTLKKLKNLQNLD